MLPSILARFCDAAMKRGSPPISCDIQNMKSPHELMQALTGDPRWTEEHNFGSGAYTSLIAPTTDPAVFATLYALARLPSSRITRDVFYIEDPYSGRTRISCSQECLGFVELASWLTPLGERYAGNRAALEHFKSKSDPRLDCAEIRILPDEKLALLKAHFDELKRNYSVGFDIAQEISLEDADFLQALSPSAEQQTALHQLTLQKN